MAPPFVTPDKKIRWVPIESNPELMNAWAEELGVNTERFQFQDVFGLDDELLGMVPQPVLALVLCFPNPEQNPITEHRLAPPAIVLKPEPPAIFIRQTIGNACGTMAMLHALANVETGIKPGSALGNYFKECIDKTPEDRAKLLEQNEAIAHAHTSQAAKGQSSIPQDLVTEFHYSAFVQLKPLGSDELRLIELDGILKGPLDHGPSTDVLKDTANVIKSTYIPLGSKFNLVSLGPAPA